MRKQVAWFFLVILTALLVAGCGSGKSIKTDEGSVNFTKDGLEISTPDGKATISAGGAGKNKLPDGYPEKIVPIMPDSEVTAGIKRQDGKLATYSVILKTGKSIQQAGEYYEEVLKGADNLGMMKTEDFITIEGNKGGYTVSVLVGRDDSGTGVTLTLTPAE